MAFENRKWVIITLADYTTEELENLIGFAMQSSVDSLRKNKDGTKTFLKWNGETPDVFKDMTTYNHQEILTELAKEEWKHDEN